MDNKVLVSLQRIRFLFVGMAVVSVATLIIAAVLHNRPDLVNWVVWVRGGAVAVASLWLIWLAGQAAKGKRSAYVRIRTLSILGTIGIVLICVAPDSGYPLWMKFDQGLIGLLLAGVALLATRQAVRAAFPKPARAGKLG
ncbi:hypothetical protein [Sphaerisporangium corydalis]|uniref:Uncharacterized protein n=1 Tax=Sphaerisporangium corydalis TaxID=1441875 RepID=A0ABV9EH23_9ACTN|nr:hypothetical protein [Sphaerisporangium corydalis]